jgi:hypothetical protein
MHRDTRRNVERRLRFRIEARRETRTLAHGYVAYWPDRADQPLASKVVHADRYCQHIADISDEYVREASGDERERLGRCGTCAE